MADFLLELAQRPAARRMIKSLGLPIPMPPQLRRQDPPFGPTPLAGEDVALGIDDSSALAEPLVDALASAKARIWLDAPEELAHRAHDIAAAAGAKSFHLDFESDEPSSYRALVLDASGLSTVRDLRKLYDFLHPLVRRVASNGRIVVVGRTGEGTEGPEDAAAQAALDGFVRSLAKEIGKRGSTAQLLRVAPGAEHRIERPLRFLLSPQSAYVSGQVLTVGATLDEPSEMPYRARELDGKVALVTGAARGIGEATARMLAGEGAHVICLDRPDDAEQAQRVADSIGGTAVGINVASDDAPSDLVGMIEKSTGRVDVVVHNAGITRDRTLAKMKPESWDLTLEINLRAIVRLTDALADGPLQDDGRIVCLSSTSGIAGNMGQTNYAASKSGVIGFVRSAACKLAPRGIAVNAIAPGFIETRMTDAMPAAIREVARRMNNLNQGGQPEDVAAAVAFLASPGAYGITGQVLRVCGGSLVGA